MRYSKLLSIILVALLAIPVTVSSAQNSSESSAELSILPVGQIPQIQPNKETHISLLFTDNFGMNWTTLQYFYGDTGILKLLSIIVTRIVWPILHPAWKPMLGYTSIKFDTEIVDNPSGWSVSISPNTIGQSTDGTKANLDLKVYVNDLSAANTVTVRIIATRYTKDGTEYGTSYFDIPIRSAKLNYMQIMPDENRKEVAPGSSATFLISIKNLGYFEDTFAVKVNTGDDKIKGVLSEPGFVIQPGETRQITLWVITPEMFFDPGTAHAVNFTAYSLKDPSKAFVGGVTVYTRGFYISPFITFVFCAIIIFALLIYFLFFYLRAKRERELYGKPEKPWKIPEERQHLEELKQDDKHVYEQERLMMDDEYKSAMLWYTSYRAAMKRKPKETKPVQKEKPKKRTLSIFKRSQKKPKQEKVETIVPVDDKSKQKALAKIQREQEKQLRKMKEK